MTVWKADGSFISTWTSLWSYDSVHSRLYPDGRWWCGNNLRHIDEIATAESVNVPNASEDDCDPPHPRSLHFSFKSSCVAEKKVMI